MVKKKSELEQVIEACKQLQKTCESIVRAMTIMQGMTIVGPVLAKAMEEISTKSMKKPKERKEGVKK